MIRVEITEEDIDLSSEPIERAVRRATGKTCILSDFSIQIENRIYPLSREAVEFIGARRHWRECRPFVLHLDKHVETDVGVDEVEHNHHDRAEFKVQSYYPEIYERIKDKKDRHVNPLKVKVHLHIGFCTQRGFVEQWFEHVKEAIEEKSFYMLIGYWSVLRKDLAELILIERSRPKKPADIGKVQMELYDQFNRLDRVLSSCLSLKEEEQHSIGLPLLYKVNWERLEELLKDQEKKFLKTVEEREEKLKELLSFDDGGVANYIRQAGKETFRFALETCQDLLSRKIRSVDARLYGSKSRSSDPKDIDLGTLMNDMNGLGVLFKEMEELLSIEVDKHEAKSIEESIMGFEEGKCFYGSNTARWQDAYARIEEALKSMKE